MAKKKEPTKFKKLNQEIGLYGGLYAKWRSSGYSGEVPQEILDQIIAVDEALTNFLMGYDEAV
jgi:hypothetical protein